MTNIIQDMLDYLEATSGTYPDCPKCGNDDVVRDDNGEYEYYFCTDRKNVGCEWQSSSGEYGLIVHDEEE